MQPDLDDCCHSGCSPCVFDLYDEALERYEIALAEWQARQARRARKTGQAEQAEQAGHTGGTQQVRGERSTQTAPKHTAPQKPPPAQPHARKRR
ncbi:oxidoreductase-like domain-containing protein [Burkholderia sp. WSM2230]|uniref:oxidoreductase-like domain-containing protein n=1 Tax=Burkholderia sp. WSM2230 TaxID=944435 RepID=UPI0004135B61|nr:oxidoreductase-like domain-containing protein [Burkholderia sp. WSM2230]